MTAQSPRIYGAERISMKMRAFTTCVLRRKRGKIRGFVLYNNHL